ncbi:MAG: NAD(P)/FAD-dependent oxidoreductase [Bacteroidetes bacterium]|nr:NAD(P)/FAD-dependent oxidoreductase [Bacteroidota bacterium]
MRDTKKARKAAIIGGGAAGFFAALHLAEIDPHCEVHIFEKSTQLLSKVKVSGGGRCNVTHACFDNRTLVQFYPRGSKQLVAPFKRFSPSDTITWFKERGVLLKTEEDGRMFPITDSSQTIINCFLDEAQRLGVRIHTQQGVSSFIREEDQWNITFNDQSHFVADALLIATGSSELIWNQLKSFGIKIEEPAPSLFTFNVKDMNLHELSGTSVEHTSIKIQGTKLKTEGPLLITHWGMSGPAILKLSAWGALDLKALNYNFTLSVSYLPEENDQSLMDFLKNLRSKESRKQVNSFSPFDAISKRLWNYLLGKSDITQQINWADLSNKDLQRLVDELLHGQYKVNGKSTFKDEFVTCGGVSLDEINFKTYESKKYPGLFFAGEVINVDAVTGGFNFQHAWTSGWIAAEGIKN